MGRTQNYVAVSSQPHLQNREALGPFSDPSVCPTPQVCPPGEWEPGGAASLTGAPPPPPGLQALGREQSLVASAEGSGPVLPLTSCVAQVGQVPPPTD